MELKHYTIADFRKLDFTNEFSGTQVIPITPLRIYSQIRNPKALPSDIVLTVAKDDDGEILGYAGALPDKVKGERCAWNSCWWVKNGVPAEVSMQLLFAFISNWNKKVLFSEMTPHTSKIIGALGFARSYTIKGFRGYFRFNLAQILPQKKKVFSTIRTLLGMADFVLNAMVNFSTIFISSKNPESILVEEVDEFTDCDVAFIHQHNSLQPSKRLMEDFNWIRQYSWLVDKGSADEEIARKYYFSYAVNRFETKWIRFTQNNKIVALINYSIRDNELKLPYVFCDSGAEELVSGYFYSMLLKDRNLVSITTFHPGLSKQFKQNKFFFFKTQLPKYSAISNELYNVLEQEKVEFQMGDGDCVFT